MDLVVLDIAMPRMTGLQAAREIGRRRRAAPPRILMLSMHDNEQYFFESLKVGACGYVLKSVADEDLVDGLPGGAARRGVRLPGRDERAGARLPGPDAARRAGAGDRC